jgi:hypothetical protein
MSLNLTSTSGSGGFPATQQIQVLQMTNNPQGLTEAGARRQASASVTPQCIHMCDQSLTPAKLPTPAGKYRQAVLNARV